MILTDAPVGGTSRVRAYNHHLGSCTTSIFASKNVSKEYKDQFPFSLHGAPFLMPSVGSALRRNMDNWDKELHDYIFSTAPLGAHEAAGEAASPSAAKDLGIGKL